MNHAIRPRSGGAGAAFAALVAALLLAAALPASAQDERSHDSGFFLRLSAGGGGAATETDDAGTKYRFSGTSGDVNIAIGGIVSPNLALHGTLYGWGITEPDLEIGSSSGIAPGDLSMAAIGGGVTYYFMPVNIYLSGSLGISRLEYTSGSILLRSATGIAFDFTVGKEWWVGESWGLGVALGAGMHSVPEEDWPDNWTGGSIGVRFSATMN